MKNVKKLLKKAMVFTLAASMLVGTPLTASAAGIRGVYSISDGNDTVKENPNDSGTGTVTNTNTNTGSGVLKENDARIIGIVLDRDTVNAEKGVTEKLHASIIMDESDLPAEKAATIREQLAGKIRWELSNADDVDPKNPKRNPAAYVAIKTPEKTQSGSVDRTVLELNPKKGTKQGEEVVVTASISGSLYVYTDPETGEKEIKEYKHAESYTASAKVFVKEYSESLAFDEAKIKDELTDGRSQKYTALAKHSVDFSECLIRTPATANDTITWVSTNTKGATVTAAGVVTFKNKGQSGVIYAIGEHSDVAKAEYPYTVSEGTAASKVEIYDPNVENDPVVKAKTINLTDDDGETYDVGVRMYAKIKNVIVDKENNKVAATSPDRFATKSNGKVVTKAIDVLDGTTYYLPNSDSTGGDEGHELYVTDTVAWTSNKPAIATVAKDDYDYDSATVTALGVGKAAITAKASSGKSAKLNVTVTAILTELAIGDENGELSSLELYSGQTKQLTAIKKPSQNKDGVKWSIAKIQQRTADGTVVTKGNGEAKMIADPRASINAKGVLTIKPMLTAGYEEQNVVVELRSAKKYDVEKEDGTFGKDYIYAKIPLPVTVEQSSVESINVKGDKLIAFANVERKSDDSVKKIHVNDTFVSGYNKKTDNTVSINVPKGVTYDIVAAASDNYDSAEDTLSFKTSNAKVASIAPAQNGKTLKVTANAKGSATVTVSGVCVDGTKAKTISTTFKVNVVQPVKTLTMNKPTVVLNKKEKKVKGVLTTQAQKVALKVTLGPKGVNTKEAVHWTVEQTAGVDHSTALADLKTLGLQDKKGKEVTKTSMSINLPAPEVGDVFVITARTASGATATSTVTVVKKAVGVALAKEPLAEGGTPVVYKESKNKDDTKEAKIGDKFTVYPYINVGTSKKAADAKWVAQGTDNSETVTYSVNKKGIVNINEKTGEVYVINSGTVTITAKTPLGKKATLKVTVAKPAAVSTTAQ